MVSVIVPIYKVEHWLRRCIDSILSQTYSELEVILVNDGSPDNCGEICDEYALRDDRIIVIHKENGGLSDARNVGILAAQGEYITFVDSDDFLALDSIEFLMDKIVRLDVDIAQCSFLPFYNESEIDSLKCCGEQEYVLSGFEALESYLLHTGVAHVSSWGKIYKAKLFENEVAFFPVGRINEDSFTTFKLFYRASRFYASNRKLYYYQLRDSSIMGEPFNLKRLDDADAAAVAVEFISSHCPQYVPQANYHRILINRFLFRTIFDEESPFDWIDSLNLIRKNIINTPKDYNMYCSRFIRLELFFIRCGIKCYVIAKPFIKIAGKVRSLRRKTC